MITTVKPRPRSSTGEASAATAHPLRWKALAVLALVQFVLILDVTVTNVALPSIKRDLGFNQAGLAWVVNAYTLMAGGLLLLGGRLADLLGRRRQFLVGLSVFAVASLSSGLAMNAPMLVASRFLQGAGEALAAPAALGLVAVLFTDPKERIKALGLWGGMAGLGGTSGTVISGALTGLVSWRLIFLVNLPVAIFALAAVPRLCPESRMERSTGAPRRLDVWGPISATGGLIAIVDGLLQAASNPWSSAAVAMPLLGGVALLGAFVLIEARVANPLIPLRFFSDRTRVVANVTTLFSASGFFAYFFLLTLYLQQVVGLRPLQAGLAYVPFGLSIGVGMGVSTTLLPRLGVRRLFCIGFLGSAVGLFLTSAVTPTSGYLGGVLPGMVVMGLFAGLSFPAAANAALHGVTRQDASLASGVQGALQQVGGAVGLSCLVTLALQHAASAVAAGQVATVAATSGYALAFRIGAILAILGALLVATLMEPVRISVRPDAAMLPEVDGPVAELA